MSERENIFRRIREALSVNAHSHDAPGLPTVEEQRRVLPAVGATFEEQLALFAKNAAELRATFNQVRDDGALSAALKRLCAEERWQRVATHKADPVWAQAASLGLPVIATDDGLDKHELEQCDAGITLCDALVAQTGTVVITSRSAGGRALSVLPPHHVVIARRDQLVPDLPAAFALVKERYGSDYPSMISLITGPSRTGDIERILVLGAHGPKKLTIFCVG